MAAASRVSAIAFVAAAALAAVASAAADSAPACLAPYELCPNTGDCVLFAGACGTCKAGEYLCPMTTSTCAANAAAYMTTCGPAIKGTHLDWTLSVDERVAFLLQHANVTEKISQLNNNAPHLERWGMPWYNWLNDDEHGVRQHAATSFPDGCGLGATWSKERLYQVGRTVGLEARAGYNGYTEEGERAQTGYHNGLGITLYAPNINLVRDPRWGRAQEVYSEDPALSGALTYNFVTGAQGNDSVPYMMTAACCKHYAAYDLESIPQQRYYFNAQVDARNFWETYMPVFRSCVVRAKGAHVMCSYNSVNGLPACGNENLLNGILRDQWNWPGFVVSDYDAWAQIKDTHAYCSTYECAASVGLKAGLDQEGGGTAAINALPAALAAGNVTEMDIDTAFGRQLRVRILLGMLDPPTMVPYNYLSNTTVEDEAHMNLARQVARESMCLYKNNRNALPLNKSTVKNIAVIGPSALEATLLQGNYAVPPTKGVVSILAGIRNAMGTPVSCQLMQDTDYYVPGQTGTPSVNASVCCQQCMGTLGCAYFTWFNGQCYFKTSDAGKQSSPGRVSGACPDQSTPAVTYAPGCMTIQCNTTDGFSAAEAAAKSADAVVVVIGLDQNIESEGNDRSTIELPGNQEQLVAAVRKANPNAPLVVVLVHGGTLALGSVVDNADAILDAWYPGQEGGNAVADVIFGDYNPAGRASVTYYESTSQLPAMGDMDLYPSADSAGITYRYFSGKPVFPFGFGLSYTSFRYSNLMQNATSVLACDTVEITVNVTNTGSVAGDEVVQLYVKQNNASVPVPNIRLADFQRVSNILPGESRQVTLLLTPEFRTVVQDGSDVYDSTNVLAEAGNVSFYVGGGQPAYFAGHLVGSLDVTTTTEYNNCPTAWK